MLRLVEKNTNPETEPELVWVPIIEVEYIKPSSSEGEFIGFKLSRFWLAEVGPGEYVRSEWEPKLAGKAEAVGERNWTFEQHGKFSLPTEETDERGETVRYYCVYTVSLWNNYNNILQIIKGVKHRLEKAPKDALFTLKQGSKKGNKKDGK